MPETPHHCHVANQTLVGIRVVCDSGFDGGLEQTFHMEVGMLLFRSIII